MNQRQYVGRSGDVGTLSRAWARKADSTAPRMIAQRMINPIVNPSAHAAKDITRSIVPVSMTPTYRPPKKSNHGMKASR